MSPTLKFVLLVLFIAAVLDIILVSIKMFPMLKRLKEIKRVRNDPDAISVEAEVIEIHEKRIGDMDKQYNVKLYYEVGYRKFYKDFILINKQSLRVGQILTLLCDCSEPEKALIQNYSGFSGEEFGLKSMFINFTLAILYIIVDVILQLYEFL